MKIVREPTRVVASVFALCGFLVAIIAGMRAGAQTGTVLLWAIGAMVVCKAVGLWAGWAGGRVVDEYMAQYRAARPVPDVRAAERALHRPEGPDGASVVDSRVKRGGA